MNFGKAIETLKEGKKVAREGWNGKGQYIELATNISYVNVKGKVINCEHNAIGNKAIAFVGTLNDTPFSPYHFSEKRTDDNATYKVACWILAILEITVAVISIIISILN